MTERVHINIDGTPVEVAAGKSVGSALIDNGQTSWRVTRHEEKPRGIFCGIGICFDCLVTIDGQPNQRACLVPVADDMHIETGAQPAGLCANPGQTSELENQDDHREDTGE